MVMQVKREQSSYGTNASSSRGAQSELKAKLLPTSTATPKAKDSADTWEQNSRPKEVPIQSKTSSEISKVEPVLAPVITPLPDLIDLGAPVPKITYPKVANLADISAFAPQIGASLSASDLTETTAKLLAHMMQSMLESQERMIENQERMIENQEWAMIINKPDMISKCKYAKNDKTMALFAVSRDWSILQTLNEQLRNDPDVVREAMSHPRAFRFASDKLKNTKDFALRAIQKHPWNFEYLSEELRNDGDVVELLRNNIQIAIDHAGPDIRNDAHFMAGLIKSADVRDCRLWTIIADHDKWVVWEKLRADSDFIFELLDATSKAYPPGPHGPIRENEYWNGKIFGSAAPALKNNVDFIVKVFGIKGISKHAIWSRLNSVARTEPQIKSAYNGETPQTLTPRPKSPEQATPSSHLSQAIAPPPPSPRVEDVQASKRTGRLKYFLFGNK